MVLQYKLLGCIWKSERFFFKIFMIIHNRYHIVPDNILHPLSIATYMLLIKQSNCKLPVLIVFNIITKQTQYIISLALTLIAFEITNANPIDNKL